MITVTICRTFIMCLTYVLCVCVERERERENKREEEKRDRWEVTACNNIVSFMGIMQTTLSYHIMEKEYCQKKEREDERRI